MNYSREPPQEAERDQRERTGIANEQEITATPPRSTQAIQEQARRSATPKGIVAYVLIAFGLAWALWIPAWLLRIPPTSQLFQWLFLVGACAPALGTIIVRRWISQEGFADAGLQLHLRSTWPYYLFAGLWPLFILGGSLALALAFGFSIRTDVFVDIVPSFMMYLVMVPLFWGEEFGWRSYLQIRLFSARPLVAALATGVIWGVWHYPAVLAGYLPNEHGLLGVLLYAWYMIPHSIILGWLRLRTGSIWPPTLAHLANNAIGPLLLSALFISGGQGDLLFSLRGLLVVIPLLLLCAWIVLSGQLKPRAPAPLTKGSVHPNRKRASFSLL
jgi:membrane protease YdiL (CAAX protease family)